MALPLRFSQWPTRSAKGCRPSPPRLRGSRSAARESPGHAAEEQRLAQRFVRRGEAADVVVDVAGHERDTRWYWWALWDTRGDAQLDALGPDRVVVVLAVDAIGVEPIRLRAVVRLRAEAAAGEAGDDRRLEAELTDGVVEGGDCRRRAVHRDQRTDGHAVAVAAEGAGQITVDRMGQGPRQLLALVAHVEQAKDVEG